ncbi:hypothetical protein ACJ41O_005121 [Fusarium nematophilum]
MHSFNLLTLFCSLTMAAVLPRAIEKEVFKGHCCFTLHNAATGAIVQENFDDGAMLLNGGKSEAWFCLDLSDPLKVLRDSLYNACFLNFGNGQLKCLDPTPGFQSWTLKKSGSNTLLAHDGDTTFNSCPNAPKGTLLYGDRHSDVATCKRVTLKAKGFKGTCKNFAARSDGE